jgi:hypothetical protein
MKQLWMIGASLLLLTSCIGGLMEGSRVPDTTTFVVPLTHERAYQRAVRAAMAIGTTLSLAQAPDLLQGTVQNAALLTVRLTSTQNGTQLDVSATILPNKLVIGAFTTTRDFQQAYQQEVL